MRDARSLTSVYSGRSGYFVRKYIRELLIVSRYLKIAHVDCAEYNCVICTQKLNSYYENYFLIMRIIFYITNSKFDRVSITDEKLISAICT